MEYRLVEHPELLPGCCFLSRTDVGPFIDTGIDLDDIGTEGRVYLAFSTVADLAQQFGYAPPEASRRGREHIAALEAQIAELSAQLEAVIGANSALVAAGYVAPDAPVVPPAGSEDQVFEWVLGSPDETTAGARARAARDAELLEPRPRESLLSRLEGVISSTKEASDGHVRAV